MAPIAIAEILITSVYFILPLYPAGAPGFMRGFLGAPGTTTLRSTGSSSTMPRWFSERSSSLLWIGWHVSAKHWFTGPKHTIDLPAGVTSADEIELEHEHDGFLTGEHQKHHPDDK